MGIYDGECFIREGVNFKVFGIGPCAILHLSAEDAYCLHGRGDEHVIFKCTSLINRIVR